MDKKEYGRLIAGIVFHPAATFRQIKRRRDEFKWIFAIGIFILFIIMFIINRAFVHFPFKTIDIRGVNFFIDVAQVVIPIVTWVFAAYLMSSIMNGEMKMKEFAISTAYALIPATALLGPITLISHLLELGQGFFYNGAITAILAWTVLLMLGSFKVLNEYEAGPFVKSLLVTILAMIVIWSIVFLLYSISNQFVGVIRSVITEIRMLGK